MSSLEFDLSDILNTAFVIIAITWVGVSVYLDYSKKKRQEAPTPRTPSRGSSSGRSDSGERPSPKPGYRYGYGYKDNQKDKEITIPETSALPPEPEIEKQTPRRPLKKNTGPGIGLPRPGTPEFLSSFVFHEIIKPPRSRRRR